MKSVVQKWAKMPESVKAATAFTFSSFFVKGISFITTPLFTRIMDTDQYGVVASYNSWSLIVEVLAVLGMTSAGILNVGMNDNKDCRDRYLSSMVGLGNVATLITFLILFLVNNITERRLIMPNPLLVLMLIHYLFYPAQIFWLTRQRYEYKYKLATLFSIFSSVIGQLIAIVAILNFKDNQAVAKLVSTEIGVVCIALPLYFYVISQGKTYYDKIMWKQCIIMAIPLLPHYLAQHIMSSSDRIMLEAHCGSASAGIYNLVFNVATIANMIWAAVNASLVPFTFEALNRKDYKKIRDITMILLSAFGIMCIGIIVIAPEIVRILGPEDYYGGIYAIPPLVGVSFLLAVYNLYANIEFYYKKSKYITTATVVATIVNVVLNYLIIPRYGYVGASYTTLISYAFLILLHFYGYRKSTKEKVYNDSAIWLFALGVVGIGFLFTLIYDKPVIRYSLVGVAGLGALIFRKKIIEIATEIKNSIKGRK